MAAAGDSITQAFDVGWCCILRDSPEYSWSSGASPNVSSHYLRLLAKNGKIADHAYNVARSGAKMAELESQLAVAAGYRVDYVTVLMGANDLCTSSRWTMTPTDVFAAQFNQALTSFFAANPSGRVFVASIPNLYRLWSVLHTNIFAQAVWDSFGICPSMLSSANTEEDRRTVLAQEMAHNDALATVCKAFANCRWDEYALFNVDFPSRWVSTFDYFHPNIEGQTAIASITWRASYWPSL